MKIKNALMMIIMESPEVSEVALCNQKGCYLILMENKTHIRMPKKTLPMLDSMKIKKTHTHSGFKRTTMSFIKGTVSDKKKKNEAFQMQNKVKNKTRKVGIGKSLCLMTFCLYFYIFLPLDW